MKYYLYSYIRLLRKFEDEVPVDISPRESLHK